MRFLKDEYGIGGRSHALSGATHSGEDHDGKGLHYKKQDCPDVHLNWEKVAKRITSLVQKDRYLTEQEQAQYDKIQAEKELAEEDAIQAQQPEVEEETPKPTLREQFEQYKTVVTAAISEDTAYRNACGHSDRENAVIEGNAAVRRAVLGSKDMELIRLYSDVPEFRQRLHREVIDETYPKLHELLRPLSQEDIDTVICAWNGNIESKHAVVRYMKDHAREKRYRRMAGSGIRRQQQPVRCPCRQPGGNAAALAEGTAQACPAYSGGPVLYRRRTGPF